jgi:uncharacterized FlaG/YvyC family protein
MDMNINLQALSLIAGDSVSAGGSRAAQETDAAATQGGRQTGQAGRGQTPAPARRDKGSNADKGAAKNPEEKKASGKTYFAVDENKNVVIRITDDNGKVVKQIPPEDYLQAAQKLEENMKSLFHKEV